MTKLLLLAALAVAAFGAGETLDSDCHDACVSGQVATFTGTGYADLNGNAGYGLWVNGVASTGQPVNFATGGVTVANGEFTSRIQFLAGEYQACSVIAKRNRPLLILACTTVKVN